MSDTDMNGADEHPVRFRHRVEYLLEAIATWHH
jgi:hypothetical protein